MVSFQCNGCGDVLTKPKLDKHRAMCHASFDCIDCSKRFETPADYKGHTSCISEAEKHQKTLYNVGKEGGPERNGRNQRLRQQGGGRQWGNNQPRWQQRNMNQATGANDTPLGTPVRMSPVNDTPVVEEDIQKSQSTTELPKKRKAEPESAESKDTSEPMKKKKKQKNIKEILRDIPEPRFPANRSNQGPNTNQLRKLRSTKGRPRIPISDPLRRNRRRKSDWRRRE
ncbi:hypothetical protein BDM02DRAFT_1137030 [Thelephora ganbajun]|uniref:Uncharacterized protein n=1 Tax=Thelephora ganbajun TaxID=370292 RepID=A0ACB6ZWV4_THEGA|nr:hypothetical protein BDM02DRAFT_1137030 [Thelephora ganbajun]